ncbi:TPA: hypothetical protein RQK74_004308 [Vibrio vulnificus]|nr:hypothetical protein [Vibrio vulnificus]HDY8002364.1 hypothetical protein [Vibrio vulnificus]
MVECEKLHKLVRLLPRYNFPYVAADIPPNGIYILFEKGECGHDGDRIVRVGTHTGENQLRSRIKQHFVNENKDRSIFRKNIGRAFLNETNDKFLTFWELDLTTKKAKERHSKYIDFDYQKSIESKVTEYIQNNFTFSVLEVDEKEKRLNIESKIISTVSLCQCCSPSMNWLGKSSPKSKIVESGLWLVNELYKTPLNSLEIDELMIQLQG